MGMIVDYLKKCINYADKLTKNKTKGIDEDDDDEDFDINKNEKDEKENQEEENKYIKKNAKKKKDDGIRELKRPIIFICNDLYSKALISLREIALPIKIEESNYERLLSRLRFISR